MVLNFLNYRRESVPVKGYLKKIVEKENLKFDEAFDIMDELTEGNMTEAQIGSLLTSLAIKNVTSEELAGFAALLKKKAISFPLPVKGEKRLDTCGTGGALKKSFNVSTISALLLASGGVKIVKHGNRAVTSVSGSAYLLEKLGINIDMGPETAIKVYKTLQFNK